MIPLHHAAVSNLRLTEIGKYQIEDVLGEGAMGVVYRALDPVLNRHVAIKIMSEALAQDSDLRERFLREAQAAGSLQHPHVVTIYDFGEVDGHPFIAMEYVEGVDLEHLLRTNVPLSVEEKIDLIVGVLQGLAYAHKKGVIHRDIKPANVRVDSEGKARIMDFGIAHLASSNMTRTGMMLGTPNYMAPEQIVGNEVTARTDIFSVGVLMYELLTNAKPFQGDTLHTVMYKVLSEMPPPLDKVLPGLPSSLNTVVMRALQKQPDQRYASALEMANDLTAIRAALGDKPSASKTLSLRASIETALAVEREARRSVERKTRYALIGVAALVVLAILGASVIVRWRSTSAQAATEKRAADSPGIGAVASGPQAPPAPAPSAIASPQGAVQDSTAGVKTASPRTEGSRSRQDSIARAQSRSVATRGEQRTPPTDARTARRETTASSPLPPPADRSQAAAGATSDAQRPPVSAPVSPTVTPASPPVTTQAPSKPAAIAQPADPAVEIASLVAAYARAIETRDLTAVRRLYPAITQTQQQGFQDLFSYTRSLKASFTVASLQVDGSTADAHLTGLYEYVTNAGREERRPVSFQATLRRENAGWRFVSIR